LWGGLFFFALFCLRLDNSIQSFPEGAFFFPPVFDCSKDAFRRFFFSCNAFSFFQSPPAHDSFFPRFLRKGLYLTHPHFPPLFFPRTFSVHSSSKQDGSLLSVRRHMRSSKPVLRGFPLSVNTSFVLNPSSCPLWGAEKHCFFLFPFPLPGRCSPRPSSPPFNSIPFRKS